MNILLVYPDYPDTFWSFKHALKFVSKKATEPPLGLLTVAAMLPEEWEKRLVDMKVNRLRDTDLEWADMVFISAMSIQRESARKVIEQCNKAGVTIVAGGPLFTSEHEDFHGVNHFVLNEAELTLPFFLHDLENGCAQAVYATQEFTSLEPTPIPMWELINFDHYATINVQYSRGCPYNCEFCDITTLFGRRVRTKTRDQVIEELDKIYHLGWRGGVFFVDDNFIGNRGKLKKSLLPSLIRWQEERGRPFAFGTEASIDLADDEELMVLMATAGFNSVFIGIETVNEDSLVECNKVQNKNRDLKECVRVLHDHGIMVKGGFIVGFDNDPPSVFERMANFIQETGIVTAMVGMLNAPRGSNLYKRLLKENRLLGDASGDNTDSSINFIPKMGKQTLQDGYRTVLQSVYSTKPYYERVRRFLQDYKPFMKKKTHFELRHLNALIKSVFILGIAGEERRNYWKLLGWTLLRRPKLLNLAVTFAIYGFHFRKVFQLS